MFFTRAKSPWLLWNIYENKNDLQKTFWHVFNLLLMLLTGQNNANLQKGKFCKKLKQKQKNI